jgi:hypothetical protein
VPVDQVLKQKTTDDKPAAPVADKWVRNSFN